MLFLYSPSHCLVYSELAKKIVCVSYYSLDTLQPSSDITSPKILTNFCDNDYISRVLLSTEVIKVIKYINLMDLVL